MSSTPIADTIRALEEASLSTRRRLHAIAAEHYAQVGTVINRVAQAPGSTDLPQALHHYRTRVNSIIADELAVNIHEIAMRRATTLKVELLLSPPPYDIDGGGYLEQFTVAGEPNLPSGVHYADCTDRAVAPPALDVTTPRQGVLGDWWLVAAISAVAHWNPEALKEMVARDGDQIVVTVAQGTYRFPATLPVDASGELTYASSPDGSILVPSLEKAVADHFGGYRHLEAGTPEAALQWLIGGLGRADRSEEFDDDRLAAMLADREPMVAHNPAVPTSAEVHQLAAEHEVNLAPDQGHVLTGIDMDGNVTAHNPGQSTRPLPMAPATVRRMFTTISWTDRGGTGTRTDESP